MDVFHVNDILLKIFAKNDENNEKTRNFLWQLPLPVDQFQPKFTGITELMKKP